MRRGLLFLLMGIAISLFAWGSDTVVIDDTMYQNQPFTAKDKHIFDTDWEGLRVWRWSKAQADCQKLTLDGYDGWQVASREELERIESKKPSSGGLFVEQAFASKMPPLGGKYDDVWFWTRESRSEKVAAFVNLKTRKSDWAEKRYKGYVLCTRSIGKEAAVQTGTPRLKKAILFDYDQAVWYSDLTQKGTGPLGNYRLLYFYCQNGLSPAIPAPSHFIKHKNTLYFFAYSGKNKKSLNLYRSNGKPRGTKKIGSIGKEVAYSPVWVGDRLYFLSSEYLPQQDDPMEEKLWVLDTTSHRLYYVGETASQSKGNIYPFAKSKTALFFKKRHFDDRAKKIDYEDLLVARKKGFKKVRRFKEKIPKALKKIKVSGKNHTLEALRTLKWGCDDSDAEVSFRIREKALWYGGRKIAGLSGIKGLKVYGATILFADKKVAILASGKHLWGADSKGTLWRIH